MDYRSTAKEVVEKIGGRENIVSAAHCATRLRLVIADNSKCNKGFCNLWPQMANSSTYMIFHLFSNAAFVYLPILIAISTAKTFGGNQFLGAVIGMIMIHSDLINAWSVSGMKA